MRKAPPKSPAPATVADLAPAPYNPRTITDEAARALEASMVAFGDISGIVFNFTTGNLVAGHQRRRVLQGMGAEAIEWAREEVAGVDGPERRGTIRTDRGVFGVRGVHWPLEKEMAANVAANSPTLTGTFDDAMLGEVLGQIEAADADLFGALRFEELWAEDAPKEGRTDPDDVPEAPPEPRTKRGDLWLLGEHRLLCGDSTNANDVARLMGGRKVDMVLTDPPYGVSYVGKTADALVIENDALSEDDLAGLVLKAFDIAEAVSRPGAYWYATVPAGPLHLIFAADWKRRGILRQIMVWAKDAMVLGHSEYHYQHEPILFGWVPGPRHKNTDRTRTTLWACDRPKVNAEHPTMKPVALWERAILDGSRSGEIVYDPFLGSGTSVIAAEQTGRSCFGMELGANYCDVIVRRWEAFTGKTATLEHTTP